MFMIHQQDATPPAAPSDIFGAYSTWPKRRPRRRFLVNTAMIGAIGVFVHCVVPLIG